MTFPAALKTPRHDHRRSMWALAGGTLLWCYRCGALRHISVPSRWIKPTGPNGKNPAT